MRKAFKKFGKIVSLQIDNDHWLVFSFLFILIFYVILVILS